MSRSTLYNTKKLNQIDIKKENKLKSTTKVLGRSKRTVNKNIKKNQTKGKARDSSLSNYLLLSCLEFSDLSPSFKPHSFTFPLVIISYLKI